MPRRKFIYDRATEGVVEVTSPEVKPLCDEITADLAERSEPLEYSLGRGKGRNAGAKWPIVSDSMSIDPEQIAEAQAVLGQHGVSTEYTPDGRPILRDRAHKKAHQAALGFADADAGYGDQAPVNYVASDFEHCRGYRRR